MQSKGLIAGLPFVASGDKQEFWLQGLGSE